MGGCTSSSAGGRGKGTVEISKIEEFAGIKVVDHGTQFFNKYEFVGKNSSELVLGEGGFSKVLRGRRINNEQTEELAVKCIDMAKISKTEKMDLMREVEILQSLTTDKVVRIYDFFDDEPNRMSWMVMELMTGGELFDRIVKKQFYTEVEARATATIIIDCIEHLHEQGIAHRDLKPENLLMKSETNDSHLKLADFGFAVKCHGNDQTAQLGTPGYVAPEILEASEENKYGTQVDMWSCGVILFVMIGGYPPFPQEGNGPQATQAMFKKIKRGEYEFDERWWSEVSPEAKDLISKLMTVDPEKRLTAKAALRHPWFLADPDYLVKHHLEKNLDELKRWNARRKLKGAVNTVIAANRIKNVLASMNSV